MTGEIDDETYAHWGLLPARRRVPIPNGGANDVGSILDPALALTPDAEAVVGRYARHSYAELEALTNSAAAGLAEMGLRQGDHIACSSTNHPDVMIAFMAAQRLGCVWIGIPHRLATPEKAHILADSEARAFLSDSVTIAAVQADRALPKLEVSIEMDPGNPGCGWAKMLARRMGAGRPNVTIDPWAPAAIAYTSGTTGLPKGVVHSQHNIVLLGVCRSQTPPAEFYSPGLRQGVLQPPTILNVMVVAAVYTWLTGGACICVDRVDAVGVAEWIEKEQIQSAVFSPATMFDLLTLPQIDPRSLDSLSHVVIGGGPASAELRAMVLARFGAPPLVSYGLTEAPGQVAISVTDDTAPAGASGCAHPHVRLEILGAGDEVLPPDTAGEVCVGPREDGPWAGVYTTMLGYWKNPEATAKALRGGWLHTGDFGLIDQGGYVTLTARMNDVILRGGANVYPAEIERVLQGMDEVRACAVVGRPDARLGETVEAFIQLMPGVAAAADTQAALEAGCRAKLARYKIPERWTFVEDMPRNSMNKIIKSKLRELYNS